MPDFLLSSNVRLIVYGTSLLVLVAIGYYVVAKVRESFSENGLGASDLMSNFRESYSQGELTDEEYRTIKATLAARLRQELKETGDAGCPADDGQRSGDGAEPAAAKHKLAEHELNERGDVG